MRIWRRAASSTAIVLRRSMASAATPRVVNSRRERFPFHAGETRQRRGALLRGEPRVSRNAAFGRFVKRAYRSRMKRVAAAVTERELPRAADLLGQRAACRVGRGLERSESDSPAPDHESDERE